jgi:hypothetical protein
MEVGQGPNWACNAKEEEEKRQYYVGLIESERLSKLVKFWIVEVLLKVCSGKL